MRYKNNKFLLFISHKRSRVWTRYFTRLCIIISSRCMIFFVNLDDFFAVIYTSFHEIVVYTRYIPLLYSNHILPGPLPSRHVWHEPQPSRGRGSSRTLTRRERRACATRVPPRVFRRHREGELRSSSEHGRQQRDADACSERSRDSRRTTQRAGARQA